MANRSTVTATLQAAKSSCKIKEQGRPTNHGIVLPGKIYRSSWPTDEDFPYLESLHLKTVLYVLLHASDSVYLLAGSSLVKNDLTPAFQSFVKKNSIDHKIIDMPGTKKVDITEEVMQSIIEIVLDEANHPILIHCNHGKVR